MRIVFVRHGHPDYKNDCLTEVGHKHAEAAAERLKDEPFARIFSSTCGRAVETAQHIASRHNLPVESFDFIREIKWWSLDGEPLEQNGHPWFVVNDMVSNGEDIRSENWMNEPRFSNNGVKFLVQNIGNQFDKLLCELGFVREGDYYRVTRKNSETVAMVSHGGASSAVLAHLFNLSFPFLCGCLRPNFTAITVVTMGGEEGDLITPRFEIANDARHIKDIPLETVFGT